MLYGLPVTQLPNQNTHGQAITLQNIRKINVTASLFYASFQWLREVKLLSVKTNVTCHEIEILPDTWDLHNMEQLGNWWPVTDKKCEVLTLIRISLVHLSIIITAISISNIVLLSRYLCSFFGGWLYLNLKCHVYTRIYWRLHYVSSFPFLLPVFLPLCTGKVTSVCL